MAHNSSFVRLMFIFSLCRFTNLGRKNGVIGTQVMLLEQKKNSPGKVTCLPRIVALKHDLYKLVKKDFTLMIR